MKAQAVFLLAIVVSTMATSDLDWLNMLTVQIEEEEEKNIPDLAADLGLNKLVEFIDKANLTDTLKGDGPFTMFGPTDEAFDKLPKDLVEYLLKNATLLAELLEYHVASGKAWSGNLTNDQLVTSLQGKSIRINQYNKTRGNRTEKVMTAAGRKVVLADQEASNGIIHVVDGVLFPSPGSLATVVSKVHAFSILCKALDVTNLTATLAGDGPFTLFAPTDKAFHRMPRRCLFALFKDKDKLKKVLEYHVVPATEYSAGLSCGDKLKTVEGHDIKVSFPGKKMAVNHVHVTFADINVDNGAMHVISHVLFPHHDDTDDFCDDVMNGDDDVKGKLNSLWNL